MALKLGSTIEQVLDEVNKKVTFTQNTNVPVDGRSEITYKYQEAPIFAPNGLIIGGTAAAAGLVTRGVCGVTVPNATTGACNKENLYLNYDGNDTNNPNGRGVVINAGSAGIDLGNGAYSYCAVRGDVMKAYIEANCYKKSETRGLFKTLTLTCGGKTLGTFNGLSDITIDIPLSTATSRTTYNDIY